MLKLKNQINEKQAVRAKGCGGWDGNCIFCDGGKWDFNS